MNRPNIAVVGSVNLDLVTEAERLPAPGETVLGSDVLYRSGGKGANQAVAALRFGAEVALVACIGDDTFGDTLSHELATAGLDLEAVRRDPSRPSGIAVITVDKAGQNTIAVAPGANTSLTPAVLGTAARTITGADAVVMQLEIPLETAIAAAETARRSGVPLVVNASPLPDVIPEELLDFLGRCDVVIVNETEMERLHPGGSTWADRARGVIARGAGAVVVTLGADGAIAVTAQDVVHREGFPVDVVDTTGAGDSFCGAMAVEIARGTSLAEAVTIACAAGALATTTVGAFDSVPTKSAVDAFLSARRELSDAS